MTIEQIIVLAVVQGITEFLPISSSGHLILLPNIMHWPDQGIVVDVMTHLGTLLAILIYFWRDVWRLIRGALELFKGKVTDEGKLAIYIVLATIPAVAFGVFLKKFGYADLERNVAIVAWNTILYGILMLIADMVGPQERTIANMTLVSALDHRRGAGACADPGHEPLRRDHDGRAGSWASPGPTAARFSFLLGIPATAGAIVFTVGDALASGEGVTMDAVYARRSPSSPAFSPSPS